MKKRLLSALLALCMVVTLLPGMVWAVSNSDITYSVTGGSIYFDAATGTITDCDTSVTEAIIPDKINGIAVTSIGVFAFLACRSLTSVTIPTSVTNIDPEAFSTCTSLTSIIIPNSLTEINSYEFWGCSGLTSITISDSVTDIGLCAFKDCNSLTDVYYSGSESQWKQISVGRDNEPLTNATIHYNSTGPDGTDTSESTLIPDDAVIFNGHYYKIYSDRASWSEAKQKCESLGGYLATITSQEEQSFIETLNSSNKRLWIGAYRDSNFNWQWVTNENWSYTNWGEGEPNNSSNVVSNENCVAIWPNTWNDLNNDNKSEQSGYICEWGDIYTSETVSILAGGNTLNILWDDEWFSNIPIYNHDLAVTSAALSWAVYSENNAKNALESLHFDRDQIESGDFDYPISSQGQAGYVIGQKQVVHDGQSYTLISVLIRGSQDPSENPSDWLSDIFDSGWFDGDSGFEDAAKIILEHLNEYLRRYNLVQSDDVKFLITGHSRGGIVANLVAAELTQHGVLNGAVDRSFGVENVFAYTFASPRPSRGAPELLLGNIYNIINSPDLIPKFPPTSSERYGLDLILPCKKHFNPYYTEENGTQILHTYSEFCRPMQMIYSDLTGKTYDIDEGNLFTVHGIAAYYSWMASHTAEELFGSTNTQTYPTFKHIRVACPVDVYVYDKVGTLLLSIEDDVILVDELAATVEDGVKDLYLPTGQEYDVRIAATDTGAVDYSIEEVETRGVGDEILRTVSFDTIDIVAGDTLTGSVDDSFSIPADDYALTKNDEEVIYPDSDVTHWVNPFTDVSESDWFYDGVTYAAQNGLMQGVGGDKFNPSGTTTRGMIVTILYRLEGEPTVSQTAFTDVAAEQWYTDAVAWAAANKIVEGYGNGNFGPNDSITREQIATILYRYAVYKGYDVSGLANLSSYTDAGTVSSWALTAVRWTNSKGLITGRTTTTLVPKGTTTRAEAATILMRFCQNVAGLE